MAVTSAKPRFSRIKKNIPRMGSKWHNGIKGKKRSIECWLNPFPVLARSCGDLGNFLSPCAQLPSPNTIPATDFYRRGIFSFPPLPLGPPETT